MKGLVAPLLVAVTLASAPSSSVAQVGSKVIQFGKWNGQVPTLERLDEFKSVETPSEFGPVDSIWWAALLAINPRVYEEIVPMYSYRTSVVCNSDGVDSVARDWGSALSAAAKSLGQDLYPGALYISFGNGSEDDGSVRWYESLNAACNSPDDYSSVVSAKAFLASMHESLGRDDLNEAYVTAIPLWGVDAVGKHWAICDPENLSNSKESACRMRLSSSPYAYHKVISADPSLSR